MKKSILIVNDLAFGGGVEKLMQIFAQEWHDKYKITILTNELSDSFYSVYPKNVRNLKTEIHFKAKRPFGHIALWVSNFVNWCRKLFFSQNDIAIAIKEGKTTRFVSELRNKNKIAWVHTDLESCHWSKYAYDSDQDELESLKKYDHVVCVSEQTKNSIKAVLGDLNNTVVCYNPINVEEIIKKSQEKVEIPTKYSTRFVSVGRLDYLKGFDLLINACLKLNSQGYIFELWIIGDGNERNKLEKIIKEAKADNIVLWGNKDNPFPYMKDADWFISSSRAEGFSIVSQEATVLGLPLMLTDCSGVRELLGNSGEYGIIMDINEDSIYENIKCVLEDQKLRKYYANKIKEKQSTITYLERLDEIENLLMK